MSKYFVIVAEAPPQKVYDVELKFLRDQLKVEKLQSEVKVILSYCQKFFDQVGDDNVSYDEKKRIDSRSVSSLYFVLMVTVFIPILASHIC